jgi:hypothetical protein
MLKERSITALNLKQYSEINKPEYVGDYDVVCPYDRQYILRTIIKEPFSEFKIPENLMWAKDMIDASYEYQQSLGIEQPFCYLTVRHGLVETVTDDVWHVDGFSLNITHLPEQNYIWTNIHPTEYVEKGFDFPSDFNHKIHNIHSFFQAKINSDDEIKTMNEKGLYALDPYVPHRRPQVPSNVIRTFVRVSFTPIEIADSNNTPNPLLERNYTRDGVKEFRDTLIDYPIIESEKK